jgi:uncharacterized repeat protein (TIGR02543 family)
MNLEHIKPKDFKSIAMKSCCRFLDLVIFIFLAVFTIPAFAYGVTSDDFNTCVIDQSLWTLVDPLGDASISIVGAGTGDAQLYFSVPAGLSHDPWRVDTAPRLLQAISNANFEVEVKFDSVLSTGYQEQGIIIEESSDHWLRFDFHHDGSSARIFAASMLNGSPSVKVNQSIVSGTPIYMRVERSGNNWVQSYSFDGTVWTVAVSFTHDMIVNEIGPFVGNFDSSDNAPAHTAIIDYFFNVSEPIEPEDGGTVPTECTLDVTVTGSGTVSVDPDQATYGCGELVTLTAIPDAGYEFTGWSGDLSGSENPATITMNSDKNITANFDPDTTPPVISNVQVTTGQSIATITWTTNEQATSVVAYGETTVYELGSEEDLTFKIDHSIILTNLNPETLYHYKITSEDSYGNANTTPDQTFVTNPDPGPDPSGIVSDDFNTCSLDAGLWNLIDPLGDAVVSIVGAGTGDAQLFFSVPAGVSHDAWTVNTAPRLLQPVNDTDFVIEVKYDSTVDEKYQSQGIIIEESGANWLRFDFYSDGSSTFIFAASFVNGSPSIKANQTITVGSPVYMQVERSGDDWTLSYSNDGLTWTEVVIFTHTMAVNALGPFVGNDGDSGAPAHTAMIDYFFNALDPIEPEDGGTVPTECTLDVTVTGSGTVSVDPDQATYGCGELVTLTAIPDAGYEFTGWSGDLSGSENPATITMNSDKNITANFDPDTTPPVISNVQVTTGQSIATITWTTNEQATSVVAYGETTVYELGSEEDLTFKIDHSIILTNLNPETLYHYKITSEDSYGNANTTPDQTFVTNPDPGPDPSGIVSDDFNTCSLDAGLWNLIDPLGDAVVSIVGAGTGDAQLFFSVPAGVSHDAWTVNTAPRLLQPVNDTDFVIEVKYDSTVDEKYQSQGIIIEESGANWLRFDFYSDGSSTFIFAASFVNGSPSIKANQTITVGSPVYMQVERSGDDWTLSYSNDGLTWTEVVIFTHTMAVNALGPFVGNDGDSGAPAHTAMIDYFFNALDPIEPEDGGTVPTECTLDVTVTGSGTVGVDPDQTTYGCGELVTLTAIPDAGYEFTSWSGDLSESENPATITMNSDKSVTANFDLDTTPPVIGNINENAGHTSAMITWTTDEPATSVVEYGETTSYELGMVEDVNLKLSHFIGLTGLIPGVEYHYRITSEDASGFSSTTVDRTFITYDGSSGAPLIQVWYGSEQTFGSLGKPQRWVNILGNVSDPDGVSVLKYSLNGGSELPLTIGPDYYRLANTGDFNVEIALTDLQDGVNQVIVTARDSLGNETAEVVVLTYASGNVWPESYTIDWSNASSIQDVAQVVDGLWQIEDGNVRVVEPGYDRIIAIGDIAWTNYEVIVPVTVHSPIPYPPTIPNPAALGLLVRWQGHVEDDNQPSVQWWPLGVFAHYRFVETSPSLRLQAQQTLFIGYDFNLQFELGVKYIFKLRSETVSGGSTYSFKVWRADESEPSDWNLVGQEPADDQTQGSLILVAHHVDASFGNVSITPLFQEEYVLNLNEVGSGSVQKVPDKSTYIYGDTVSLTATADPGWVFTGWSGDLSGNDNPATVIMTGDRNITATFSAITQHTLDVTTVGNGWVSVDPDQAEYDLGQQVTLTATADPGWVFTGWSGDLSGFSNPATLTITGDHQVTATFVDSTLAYAEDFEAYTDGEDPVDWMDTAANNSMSENNSLFKVFNLAGNKVFGTTSTQNDIHSHFMGPSSTTFSAYEYTGRMMMTASSGGIGVTFLSQYPVTDAYYRLRRHSNNSFHIAPHGTSVFGVTDTGVVPAANVWYRFRVWIQDTGSRTEIRAKVWPDGGTEPATWQVDAYDDSLTRLTSGTFGVWSYGSGSKYWDDLLVNLLDASSEELTLSMTISGNGMVDVAPDQVIYSFGEEITLTATADAGWVFTGWSGDLSGNDNPATVIMTGDRNITATFSAITQHTLDVTTVGNGWVSVDPDQAEYDLGQQVTLTATADPGWVFTGWSGDLSGFSNPATLTITGDHQVTATFVDSTLAYAEDFEAYTDGEDPVDWMDTAANNSMSEDDNLFQVVNIEGGKVFGTASTLTNIHSHYTGPGSTVFSDYEYTGRMMMTASNGGIGVTFLSQYPVTDAYYRLRRYSSNSFHISPHGTSIFGVTDTGVVPIANNWYRFRVRVQDTGIRTEILAKVWLDGDVEPIDWQVDAYDDSITRLTSGTFGTWSYASGSKYWDDLMVILFSP